jgi:catechol 2,3-dioxygenase-like lactoylglutathione lyase family enzyme
MYPILPCPDLDDAIAFYEALGFRRTYRQLRPYPAAVVQRDAMAIHLGGIDGFDPQQSYASVIIVVPDPDALYRSFADGLRRAMGRVPVAGIPRMVRPRKKWGTVYGFSVVDVGGNWLRFSRIGDREPAADEATGGLVGIVEVAARLADSKGDDAQAIATLERGIARHADAPAVDRARALLYLAELAVRVGDDQLARSSFGAALTVELDAAEREALGPDVTHVEALLGARA